MTSLIMQKEILFAEQIEATKFKYAPLFKKGFKIGSPGDQKTIFDMCRAIREYIFAETGKKIGKWEYDGGVVERYPCPFKFLVTGDASGNTTSGMVKDPTDYYDIIKDELGLSIYDFYVPDSNPWHSDSWLQVNTIFQRCPDVGIDKENCDGLIKDIEIIKDDGKHGIAKKSGEHQADSLDCMRYIINTFCDDIRSE